MTIADKWPNNKPTLTTEYDLAMIGKAVVCREPVDSFGRVAVWTLDKFGRNEMHFLMQEKNK